MYYLHPYNIQWFNYYRFGKGDIKRMAKTKTKVKTPSIVVVDFVPEDDCHFCGKYTLCVKTFKVKRSWGTDQQHICQPCLDALKEAI